MDYYGKLKKLWDELGNFEQLPACKCGKCTCNLGSELEKRREEEKVHLFLMGLDEQRFGTTRSNILAQDPLPGLHKVYSILTQEEQVKGMTRGREEQGEFVAFVARTRTDGRQQGSMTRTDGQEKGICSHCHKSGHEEDNCFALTGYPEWWGDRPRGDERREAGRGRGYSGGRGRGRGHRGTHRANAALTTIGSSSATFSAAGGGSSFPGLSDEQWEKLKAILGEPKEITNKMTGKPKNLYGTVTGSVWILDTGASNHMTGSIEELNDLKIIDQCPVGLPDGSSALAVKEGTTVLDGDLCLENVLYVPGLTCNLISVSQLIDQYDCFVLFTKKLCVIQGHTSRMLIGAGERRDGLYYFKGIPQINTMKISNKASLDLWHQRLGHPSLRITKLVPEVHSSNQENSLNKNCDVCQRAK